VLDPARAEDLRRRGRVRVRAFDWDRTVAGVVALYRDAAG
jgi:hypothetical protein